MFPSPVETERLVLRRPATSDATEIFDSYASNPRVTRYLRWPAHRSIADTVQFLGELNESIDQDEQFAWVLIQRKLQRLCGMIGVVLKPPRAAVGYCLAEDVWGQGYACEAAAAIIPLVWQRPDVESVEAHCHTNHTRSARVLEKVGLRYVGIDREHTVLPALGPDRQDMLRYAACRPKGLDMAANHCEAK